MQLVTKGLAILSMVVCLVSSSHIDQDDVGLNNLTYDRVVFRLQNDCSLDKTPDVSFDMLRHFHFRLSIFWRKTVLNTLTWMSLLRVGTPASSFSTRVSSLIQSQLFDMILIQFDICQRISIRKETKSTRGRKSQVKHTLIS